MDRVSCDYIYRPFDFKRLVLLHQPCRDPRIETVAGSSPFPTRRRVQQYEPGDDRDALVSGLNCSSRLLSLVEKVNATLASINTAIETTEARYESMEAAAVQMEQDLSTLNATTIGFGQTALLMHQDLTALNATTVGIGNHAALLQGQIDALNMTALVQQVQGVQGQVETMKGL